MQVLVVAERFVPAAVVEIAQVVAIGPMDVLWIRPV